MEVEKNTLLVGFYFLDLHDLPLIPAVVVQDCQ